MPVEGEGFESWFPAGKCGETSTTQPRGLLNDLLHGELQILKRSSRLIEALP
jgi:hypothetical protein